MVKILQALQATARQIWNEALSKIEGGWSGLTKRIKLFFILPCIAVYERPVCLSEGWDDIIALLMVKVHEDNGRPFYTDDWIWDSYRAHHPLNALIDSKKEEDIINSFVTMAEQMDNFWMPTFPGSYGG